jgi:uncharacterized protein
VSGPSSDITIDDANGPRLAGYFAPGVGSRGVVLIHGFPSPKRPGAPSRTYHQLADRVAGELDYHTLALSLRGCGESEGQFTPNGWVADVRRAVDWLCESGCAKVWLVGSTTGGSLALLAAATDERVRGVATVAARADFDDWAREPGRFVEHCRRVRVITDDAFPADLDEWARELEVARPLDAAAALADRSLLVLHGARDRQVPSSEARDIASAHGAAELRILDGGDHRLRNDPRFVALLFGWLERQQP